MGSSIAGVIAADRAVQRMSLAYAQAELERLREAMRDGVDVDDSHLADVLDRVRRAREWAESRTWDRAVDVLEEALNEIVQEKVKPAPAESQPAGD